VVGTEETEKCVLAEERQSDNEKSEEFCKIGEIFKKAGIIS